MPVCGKSKVSGRPSIPGSPEASFSPPGGVLIQEAGSRARSSTILALGKSCSASGAILIFEERASSPQDDVLAA